MIKATRNDKKINIKMSTSGINIEINNLCVRGIPFLNLKKVIIPIAIATQIKKLFKKPIVSLI